MKREGVGAPSKGRVEVSRPIAGLFRSRFGAVAKSWKFSRRSRAEQRIVLPPSEGPDGATQTSRAAKMLVYAIKVIVTGLVVVGVVELAKRSSLWGALLPSLPSTALLAFVWLYLDTGSAYAVAKLSVNVFWLVVASLPLFVLLPVLLGTGWPFWPSLAVASGVTLAAYITIILVLHRPELRG
jgi:hypothetical protein